MRNYKFIWIIGLVVTAALILIPIFLFLPHSAATTDPWAGVPDHPHHTDHSALMEGPFETGADVTRACLDCHEDAADQVMHTAHWTWESEPVLLEGRDEPVTVGKKNQINNFCIGVQGNWPSCTTCHTGYGWEDANFDFTNGDNVDCLVCHDTSGGYAKGTAGNPVEGVDLLAVAQSVGAPTRENCGSCHFNGGGGNGVKHGDLDESLYFPDAYLDVHMGEYDFLCTDCHQATDHNIKGRSISVSVDDANQVYCTDCHDQNLHEDERINAHTDTVACQTCHVPAVALKEPTKTYWDWSTAGRDDIEEDHYTYLKIKGSFVYETDITPAYTWYNGTADRYLLGDTIDPTAVTSLNTPNGSIDDPNARIFPFKIHVAKQIYDTEYDYLLQPKTVGEGGFWTEFDWDLAAELGAEATNMAYSGSYDFAETEMYWPLTHMVQPGERALQCQDCHDAENGRMDWQALGYPGDPMYSGSRTRGAVSSLISGQSLTAGKDGQ